MKYRVKIIAKAERDLNSLEGYAYSSITNKIILLSKNPRPFGCKKLIADEGYRIRTGDFRILYRIDDDSKEVIIYRVKHRREAYR